MSEKNIMIVDTVEALEKRIEEVREAQRIFSTYSQEQVEKIDDYHYRVHFNASNNISEKIVQLSVSNNWGLKEITLERQSLDNIFAQLSGKIKTLK